MNGTTEISQVLRKNFFDASYLAVFYGIDFTKEQLDNAPKFPWKEDILLSTCPLCGKIVKDCHFAFLGIDHFKGQRFNVAKFHEMHPNDAQPRFMYHTSNAMYLDDEFATKITMEPRWYLSHVTVVPDSENKPFEKQKCMLPWKYEVPSVIAEVAKNMYLYKMTGKYANPSQLGRCADLDSHGHRISVGSLDEEGLQISRCYGEQAHRNVGIAATRRIPASGLN